MAPCADCQKEAKKLAAWGIAGGVVIGAAAVYAALRFRK